MWAGVAAPGLQKRLLTTWIAEMPSRPEGQQPLIAQVANCNSCAESIGVLQNLTNVITYSQDTYLHRHESCNWLKPSFPDLAEWHTTPCQEHQCNLGHVQLGVTCYCITSVHGACNTIGSQTAALEYADLLHKHKLSSKYVKSSHCRGLLWQTAFWYMKQHSSCFAYCMSRAATDQHVLHTCRQSGMEM